MRRRIRFMLVWMPLYGAAVAFAEVRQEIHFPDLPGYHTLKCDFHMHTVFSDGYVWPTVRVDEAWREGLDVIALTDHIEIQSHKQDIPTNHNRPYELAAEKARQLNILLIKGAEITRDTPPGHFNAIFLDDIDPLDTSDLYDVFQNAVKQKAFVFWNHPGWKGLELGRWSQTQSVLYEKKWLHGIEVCNGKKYYPEAHQWAIEKGLTIISNSDSHYPSPYTERTPELHRTLTLVFANERTLPAVKEALAEGRTVAWYQNQLIGHERYLSAIFKASVEIRPVHHRSTRRSRNTLWIEIRNNCDLDIELERAGQRGPAQITLPALNTAVVKIDVTPDQEPESLQYRATNFLIGPDRALPVNLKITLPPLSASAPAPANKVGEGHAPKN